MVVTPPVFSYVSGLSAGMNAQKRQAKLLTSAQKDDNMVKDFYEQWLEGRAKRRRTNTRNIIYLIILLALDFAFLAYLLSLHFGD
jgi:hypothetical protein